MSAPESVTLDTSQIQDEPSYHMMNGANAWGICFAFHSTCTSIIRNLYFLGVFAISICRICFQGSSLCHCASKFFDLFDQLLKVYFFVIFVNSGLFGVQSKVGLDRC